MSRLTVPVFRPLRPLGLRALAMTLGLSLLLPVASWASALEVLAAAAQSGTRGLRVTVGSSCTVDDQTITQQTLSGPYSLEACDSVTSSSTTVSSGQVTFRAGDRIFLGEGFVVEAGANFTAEVDRTLQRDAYLEDLTPQTEPHYAAGFYIRLDALSLGTSDRFDLFTGLSSNADKWINLLVKKTGSENRLIVEVRQNGGSVQSTEGVSEIQVPSGWHWLSLDWKISSGSANDGWVRLYLDGTLYTELTGIANSNGQIDTVRLGAIGVDPATSGSFDIDQFVSRIAGPINPPQ